MTYRALYLHAKRTLQGAGVDSPGFDAAALADFFFGLDRPGLSLRGEERPEPCQEQAFLQGLAQRANRRPLQYILGNWPFMGLELAVGEGVLIPREDTAVLVEAVAERLGPAPPQGLDLCAGTGAVGLGLCSLRPDSQVVCVELSEKALAYLKVNLERYPQFQVTGQRENVLFPQALGRFPRELDFIASNPPYIATEELAGLQPEVRLEPMAALDGGKDGLIFYRKIAALWLPLLKSGGVLGVEIGEEQGLAVKALFLEAGLTKVEIRQDLAGLNRVVIGTKG